MYICFIFILKVQLLWKANTDILTHKLLKHIIVSIELDHFLYKLNY